MTARDFDARFDPSRGSGSVKTLSYVFSEGRKFRMSMTAAHQVLSQLAPRMLGALSNVQTKVITHRSGNAREAVPAENGLRGRVPYIDSEVSVVHPT